MKHAVCDVCHRLKDDCIQCGGCGLRLCQRCDEKHTCDWKGIFESYSVEKIPFDLEEKK